MPSAETLLLARRDQFREEVTRRELAEPPPPVDPPIDDDGGGGDDDENGLWFEAFGVVIVDEAPAPATLAGPRELHPHVVVRMGSDPLLALRVIADADPGAAQCWKCGDIIGWSRIRGGDGGDALEWRPVALVEPVTESGDDPRPVNPFCEACAPFATHAPLDPEGSLVTAGGWLGDLSRCVRSPDGVRVLHVWVDGAGSCACDGTVKPSDD